MNCQCRSKIESLLLERFQAQAPEAMDHGVALDGYGFGVAPGGEIVQVGQMAAKLTANFPHKRGGVKLKSQRVFVHFRFCPFCGEKAQQGATDDPR